MLGWVAVRCGTVRYVALRCVALWGYSFIAAHPSARINNHPCWRGPPPPLTLDTVMLRINLETNRGAGDGEAVGSERVVRSVPSGEIPPTPPPALRAFLVRTDLSYMHMCVCACMLVSCVLCYVCMYLYICACVCVIRVYVCSSMYMQLYCV